LEWWLYNDGHQPPPELHNSIISLQQDTALSFGSEHGEHSQIADASDRLDYVVRLTDKAANRTMDLVESSAPVVSQLGKEAAALREEWKRLQRRELPAEGFRCLCGTITVVRLRRGKHHAE